VLVGAVKRNSDMIGRVEKVNTFLVIPIEEK
jgi:hypothetical protein